MLRLHRCFISLVLGTFLTLAAAAGNTASFEDTMAQRTLACTACHGEQGRAGPDGYYPRLAGKPAGYLYNQLTHFREGRRHYALMTGLIDTLDDAYLREIAAYFSALDLPHPPPKPSTASAALMARGQALATRGDAARKIPACTQCHGTALTGVLPSTPGLLGLPRDYLNAQLGGWKTGQRHSQAPDCMADIARQLSVTDVNAVTHWLAAQPVPRPSHAADKPPPRTAGAPDLTCGSTARPTPTPTPPVAETSVARGAYLARIGNCALCHTARGGEPYAGGKGIATPFGSVYSSNLTPDKNQGLGLWSPQDFWRALHDGESRDGHLLYPAFPYTHYTHVTREDSDALYAYLQTLPASARPNAPHALRWPFSTQLALRVWRWLNFSPADAATPAAEANPTPQWTRGAYLVQGLGHCSACHSSRNALGAISKQQTFAGGMLPESNWYAPSLRSPQEAGLANWSTGDIVALLKTGQAPAGSVSGPMAEVVHHSTQYLTDTDAAAMATYLQSLASPGALAAAPRAVSLAPAKGSAQGAALYDQHCAQCHGKQGQGQPGAYPALAGNRAVTMANPSNLVQIVLYGGYAPSTQGNPRPFGMPPFQLRLSAQELAAVLTYIRTAWGNTGRSVEEFDINQSAGLQRR
ncbi:MAG: c-type cytochrome [Rhodoferax sp.]